MSNQILMMIFGLRGSINPSTLLGVTKEGETAQVKHVTTSLCINPRPWERQGVPLV